MIVLLKVNTLYKRSNVAKKPGTVQTTPGVFLTFKLAILRSQVYQSNSV